MVERRWATMIVVMFFPILLMVFIIAISERLSRLEVASSRTRIFGFRKRVLANAILCRSPPDKEAPFSQIFVAKRLSSFEMNPKASAYLAALKIPSGVASWLPHAMFSSIVPLNKRISCGT